MNHNTDIKVLDKLVIVNLDIHIWSARRKLFPIDLGDAELPPEEVASLGSKRICDPDELRIFGALKARASNLLDHNGIRFLSGWAIPETRMDDVAEELKHIKEAFDKAKEGFLLRYDQSVQTWIGKHPAWGELISGSVVSKDYVRDRLGFKWQMYQVQTPADVSAGALHDSLREDVGNLGITLFDEIAKEASEAWRRCYEGKQEITRKALSPLRSIYDKLMGLTFIEPRVAPTLGLLETALSCIPKRGAIKGDYLLILQGMVSLLKDPATLLQHGQLILEGRKQPQNVLSAFLQGEDAEQIPEKEQSVFEEKDSDQPATPANSLQTIESCGLW